MAEKMTRGQIQDLVGKFATENPKYRSAYRGHQLLTS